MPGFQVAGIVDECYVPELIVNSQRQVTIEVAHAAKIPPQRTVPHTEQLGERPERVTPERSERFDLPPTQDGLLDEALTHYKPALVFLESHFPLCGWAEPRGSQEPGTPPLAHAPLRHAESRRNTGHQR